VNVNAPAAQPEPIPLRDQALYRFGQRLWSMLKTRGKKNNSISHQAQRKRAALKLLEQTPCLPEDLNQLQLLHQLWHQAGCPEKACDLVTTYGQTLLQVAPKTGTIQQQTRLCLLLMEIKSRQYFDYATGMLQLRQCMNFIKILPVQLSGIDTLGINRYSGNYYFYFETNLEIYWQQWLELAQAYHAWELAEKGIDAQQEQAERLHDSDSDRPWKRAMACIDKAKMARWHSIKFINGNAPYKEETTDYADVEQRVDHYINQAIYELGQAPPNPERDYFSHWLHLAARLIDEPIMGEGLSPQQVVTVLEAGRKHVQQINNLPPCPVIQRHYTLCEAQLIARSYYLLDEDSRALSIASYWHFNTERINTNDHRFDSSYLVLLESSGQLDVLASLALEAALHVRAESAVTACVIAQRQLKVSVRRYPQTAETRAAWQLIMAWAVTHPDIKTIFKNTPCSRNDSLAAACALVPDHPVADLIQGWQLADKMHWEEALPLLERGIVGTENYLVSGDMIIKLWCCRFAVLSVNEALARSWILAGSAGENMRCGQQWLDTTHLLHQQGFKNYAHARYYAFLPPKETQQALALYYLERTLTTFDHFINTPPDHPAALDGFYFTDSPHPEDYSRVCYQLAAIYLEQKQVDKAISLHKKGIKTRYCLREHYAGLLKCKIEKDAAPEIIIELAEHLWHEAQTNHQPAYWDEYPESPHLYPPLHYVETVALCLERLGRGAEIAIWIKRLLLWLSDKIKYDDFEDSRQQLETYSTCKIKCDVLLKQLNHYDPGQAKILYQEIKIAFTNNPAN